MIENPDALRAEYSAMSEGWALPAALMGGTRAMRKAGEDFLPKEPKESERAYDRRLKRSVLLNEYARNIRILSGYVFAKPPEFKAGDDEVTLTDDMQEIVDDVDRDGTPLSEFAQAVFEAGTAKGLCHILVDMPMNSGDGSLASQKALGLRPYFVLIQPEALIGWQTKSVNGQTLLTGIRYKTTREDDSEQVIEQIRHRYLLIADNGVTTGSEEQVYEQQKNDAGGFKWTAVGDPIRLTAKEITLASFFADRTGFMTSRPPFEDLAWMNLRWWQSYSDQTNILHVARVPILFGKNMTTKEGAEQEIGANAMITGDDGSELKWVEHTGRAVGAGRQDILDIEERMQRLSVETYMKRLNTATAAGIDADQSMSLGQLLAVNLGQCLTKAMQFAAEWSSKTFEGEVLFNTRFGYRAADAATINALNAARDRGDLSRKAYLEQLANIRVVENLDYEANDADLDIEAGLSLEDEEDGPGTGQNAGNEDDIEGAE